jgi:hypothetical protein
MHGGTNDLCVEEFSAGESPATRTLAGNGVLGIVGLGFRQDGGHPALVVVVGSW